VCAHVHRIIEVFHPLIYRLTHCAQCFSHRLAMKNAANISRLPDEIMIIIMFFANCGA